MSKTFFQFLTLLIIVCGATTTFAQSKPAYQLFTAKGKRISYSRMLKKIQQNDVILFGELHNNPISHWLELELAIDMSRNNSIHLGAEMFEADNQSILTAYLEDKIDEKEYKEQIRLWPNYKTDYKPLVEWAKENDVKFTATNIPRRYANMVFKNDFQVLDSLSSQEKSWIAPLPIPFDENLETYQEILTMMGDHGSPLLVKAQAIKDATMAYTIVENREPNTLFLHYNGAFHSRKNEGIVWYINQYRPSVSVVTITTVEQQEISKLKKENKYIADFILVVPETMTKTY